MRVLDALSCADTAGLSQVKCRFTYSALARSSRLFSPSQQSGRYSRIASG